jgi:hypothetical protein
MFLLDGYPLAAIYCELAYMVALVGLALTYNRDRRRWEENKKSKSPTGLR